MIYYAKLLTMVNFTDDGDIESVLDTGNELRERGTIVVVERLTSDVSRENYYEFAVRPVDSHRFRYIATRHLDLWLAPLSPLETLAYHDRLGIE